MAIVHEEQGVDSRGLCQIVEVGYQTEPRGVPEIRTTDL